MWAVTCSHHELVDGREYVTTLDEVTVKAILSEIGSNVGHLFCSSSSTNDLLSYGGKTDEVTHAGSWFKAHLVCSAFLLALKTQAFCLCGCLPGRPIWSRLDFFTQQLERPADFPFNKSKDISLRVAVSQSDHHGSRQHFSLSGFMCMNSRKCWFPAL